MAASHVWTKLCFGTVDYVCGIVGGFLRVFEVKDHRNKNITTYKDQKNRPLTGFSLCKFSLGVFCGCTFLFPLRISCQLLQFQVQDVMQMSSAVDFFDDAPSNRKKVHFCLRVHHQQSILQSSMSEEFVMHAQELQS